MNGLTYDQKLILLLYESFFSKRYPFDASNDERTRVHINVEKMCYLLQLNGLDIGGFCYSWNKFGPFSPGLLAVLRSLDLKKQDADSFYESGKKISDYLSEAENERIFSLIRVLFFNNCCKDINKWMELLGSLAFLSNSVLPGEDFVRIHDEIVKRKKHFSDREENILAWNVLKQSGLLKSVC